jgi:hypothetical protein
MGLHHRIPGRRARYAPALAVAALLVTAPPALAGRGGDVTVNFRVVKVEYRLTERVQVNLQEDIGTTIANIQRTTTINVTGRRGDTFDFTFLRRPFNRAPVGQLNLNRSVTANTVETGTWSVTRPFSGRREGGSCDGRRRYGPGQFSMLLTLSGSRATGELRPFNVQGPDREGCGPYEPGVLATELRARISLGAGRFRNSVVTIPVSATRTFSARGRNESAQLRGAFTLRR